MNFDKIKYYSIFLFAFFLPFKYLISNYFLVIFLVSAVIQVLLDGNYRTNYKPLWFSTIILIIPLIVGLLYTEHFDIGINHIGQSISFLVLPLVFSFLKYQDIKITYSYVKRGLVFGVLLSVIVLCTYTLLKYFIVNQEKVFLDILNYNYTRANFTNLFNIHPTYLGVYLLFSTVLVINELFIHKRKVFFYIVTLLFFMLGVLFVNSRIVFLIYLIIVSISLLVFLRLLLAKKSFYKFSLIIASILALTILSVIYIQKTYIYYRFTKELQWEFSDDINSFYTYKKKSISDPRLARLKGAFELVKDKPIFGYGTGSEKKVLSEMYKNNNMINSYKYNYDSHNQYLSYLISFGVFGLGFLLFFLISNSFIAFQYKDFEYFGLFLIVSIVSLVDNYLTRNAGITFFAIMSTLYLFLNFNGNEKAR